MQFSRSGLSGWSAQPHPAARSSRLTRGIRNSDGRKGNKKIA
jgi:hypothetical protein